jgi:S-adenosyl methyltransferase
MPAGEAAALCGEYMKRAAPGSWLIVSTGHYQDKELASRLQETATHSRFRNHSAADLASILDGLKPVAPGVSEGRRWMAGTGGEPAGTPAYPLVAVGIKSG